jgi:hypothetical protein
MKMNPTIGRSARSKAPLLIVLLLILSSCGFLLVPVRKEKTRSFAVRAADFDNAFDLSIKAARDINLEVSGIRKDAGTFGAQRGYGVDEITVLNFHLKKGYKRKLYITIKVKSSKGSISVMNEFTASINKYLDILPMEGGEKPL